MLHRIFRGRPTSVAVCLECTYVKCLERLGGGEGVQGSDILKDVQRDDVYMSEV